MFTRRSTTRRSPRKTSKKRNKNAHFNPPPDVLQKHTLKQKHIVLKDIIEKIDINDKMDKYSPKLGKLYKKTLKEINEIEKLLELPLTNDSVYGNRSNEFKKQSNNYNRAQTAKLEKIYNRVGSHLRESRSQARDSQYKARARMYNNYWAKQQPNNNMERAMRASMGLPNVTRPNVSRPIISNPIFTHRRSSYH